MTIEILDPTYDQPATATVLAKRLLTLDGAIVGVVSNGKQGTNRFFDALRVSLMERHGVADVIRATKENYSAPAGPDVFDRAKEWNALVAGVGD